MGKACPLDIPLIESSGENAKVFCVLEISLLVKGSWGDSMFWNVLSWSRQCYTGVFIPCENSTFLFVLFFYTYVILPQNAQKERKEDREGGGKKGRPRSRAEWERLGT